MAAEAVEFLFSCLCNTRFNFFFFNLFFFSMWILQDLFFLLESINCTKKELDELL
jgi:hypothetical protein